MVTPRVPFSFFEVREGRIAGRGDSPRQYGEGEWAQLRALVDRMDLTTREREGGSLVCVDLMESGEDGTVRGEARRIYARWGLPRDESRPGEAPRERVDPFPERFLPEVPPLSDDMRDLIRRELDPRFLTIYVAEQRATGDWGGSAFVGFINPPPPPPPPYGSDEGVPEMLRAGIAFVAEFSLMAHSLPSNDLEGRDAVLALVERRPALVFATQFDACALAGGPVLGPDERNLIACVAVGLAAARLDRDGERPWRPGPAWTWTTPLQID